MKTIDAKIGCAAALAAGLTLIALPVRAESSAWAVAAGYSHACAVRADHTLWCWGANDSGQLGDGTTVNRALPVQVAALGGAVAEVSAGDLFTCARKTDHTLWCWGNNASGQLGNGTTADSLAPVQVTALGSAVAEVSAGDLFACARQTDGTAWCWGSGPLGNGTSTPQMIPVQVAGLGNKVAEISTGDGAVCARQTDGTLWCWGFNSFGIVGDGTTTDRLAPVQVTTLGATVTAVSVGDVFACALRSDGSVWCWGTNDKGQLADGTTSSRFLPAPASGLPAAAGAVSANGRHACARLADDRLFCWGWNQAGELGDGTTTDRHAPTAVATLGPGVLLVSTSVGQNSCAALTDGSIWCWGDDAFGQVGDGGGVRRTAPVRVLAALQTASVPLLGSPARRAALALLLALVAWIGLARKSALAAVALVLAATVATGCNDTKAPAATPAGLPPGPGSIAISLQVPATVQIATVDYQITRGTFTAAGALDVSHSASVTGLIGGLPAGTGYQISLTATDPTKKLVGCAGTSSFDVTGGAVTPVAVDVTCHQAPPAASPSVPIPFTAVVILAGALLGAGLPGSRRSRGGRSRRR